MAYIGDEGNNTDGNNSLDIPWFLGSRALALCLTVFMVLNGWFHRYKTEVRRDRTQSYYDIGNPVHFCMSDSSPSANF